MRKETIQFHNGSQARALYVSRSTSSQQIIESLELPKPRALVVLNGGTVELKGLLQMRLRQLLQDGLACIAQEEGITLVTGGTNAGIFALLGEGLAKWGRSAPCIGVAVADLVRWPIDPAGGESLEPHHSHFVLIPGENWGDETMTMYDLVASLSHICPSLAIFAGGGEITKREMEVNVEQEREMILLAGSGRTTDTVIGALDTGDDSRLAEIAQKGKIIPFNIESQPSALSKLIRHILFK
jgi:hypothetical protein